MLGALWALWSLSILLLFGLWWLNLSSSVSSVLRSRQIAALESTPQLEEALQTLQHLGRVMLGVSVQEAEDNLNFERFVELREQGRPYYRFYFLDAAGRPVFPRDTETASSWLIAELKDKTKRGSPVILRPLPPGYQTSFIQNSGSVPENYLAYAQSISGERYLAWVLDWDYVFGPWIRKQLQRFGLGESVRASLEPWGTPEPEVPSPQEELSLVSFSTIRSDNVWSWKVEALLPRVPQMLDSLRLTIDNRQAVQNEVRRHLAYLLAGVVLLGGFAVVLLLTNRALRREAEYTQAKSLFVSQVSHELRTPITALEMYLEILSDGLVHDSEKVGEYHRILRRESHRLKRLVENLLTVGLIDSGHWEPKMQSFDLLELVDRVIRLENREQREVCFEPPQQQMNLKGDKEALYGVIANLLQNALKYSPGDRPVELVVRLEGSRAEIAVSDLGESLSAEDYNDLFRPYFRAEQAAGNKPGVGLGLALVKQIVEAHGGRVWGSPRPGGGSVFTVQLPREP
jgi:signal transduction histidine kinase